MTTTVHTPARAPFGAITTFRAVEAVSALVERVRIWRETRHTVAMLRALTPAQLDDIGLTPGDIDSFARTGRW